MNDTVKKIFKKNNSTSTASILKHGMRRIDGTKYTTKNATW